MLQKGLYPSNICQARGELRMISQTSRIKNFSRPEKELDRVNNQSTKCLLASHNCHTYFLFSNIKRAKHSDEDNEEIIVDDGNTDSSSEHESVSAPTITQSETNHESPDHEADTDIKKDQDLTVYVNGERTVIYSCHICDCFFLKEVSSFLRLSTIFFLSRRIQSTWEHTWGA